MRQGWVFSLSSRCSPYLHPSFIRFFAHTSCTFLANCSISVSKSLGNSTFEVSIGSGIYSFFLFRLFYVFVIKSLKQGKTYHPEVVYFYETMLSVSRFISSVIFIRHALCIFIHRRISMTTHIMLTSGSMLIASARAS